MTASRGKIFVVDDDNDFRESLRDLLDVAGFEVVALESALRFLDEAKDLDAICLIADIRMPGMDGLELQEELNARGSRLPVIIMTGHGDVPLAVRAMRAGAVDFLEKPFDCRSSWKALSARESAIARTAPGQKRFVKPWIGLRL
jgi:two-component system response regulator FixJ